ncbi:DUF4139 domain-containing protein [Persephonella atlantica]|uniref:DUF4139 domain-containing protein n=1 Tax=Persephonella atlantica TaxID=2699429 RepID=A0ABS1GIQ0_9AQUI|nr:DUF4139 domain-containing protein [Persephonella atlantica]MBK3332819.1 DUF4139 domain-containing protein [Persephonella atlantica]
MNVLKAGLALLLTASLSYGEVLKPEKLFVFKNTAFLFLSGKTTAKPSIQLKLPYRISLDSLNIEIPECSIVSMNEIPPEKSFKQEIEKLQSQITFLQNQRRSIQNEIRILEGLNINSLKNLNSLDSYTQRYFKKLQELKTTEQLLDSTQKQIQQLKTKRGKNIRIFTDCPKNSIVHIKITHQLPIKIKEQFVVSGDTSKNSVKITGRLFLKHDFFKDLKDIDLVYYSYIKTPAVEPPEYFLPSIKKAVPQKSVYTQTQTRFFYEIKNITLLRDRENLATVVEKDYPAKFYVYIDGRVSPVPFLKAEFNSDIFLPPVFNTQFFIDGLYIGSNRLKAVKKGKNSIYFGEDIFISVSKEKVKDYTEETFFGKKITTKKWRYTLRNGHSKNIKIVLKDKIPVSTTENVKIKPFSSLKWKEIKSDGTVIWEFSLKPQEKLEIEFGYRIERREERR